jgi:hypothetical protein
MCSFTIIVLILYPCVLSIYGQNNKTLQYKAIAKPHPKGMLKFNKI